MEITVRAYRPGSGFDTDESFLYATWTNNAWYSPKEPIIVAKGLFFKGLLKHIKETLERSEVLIACAKDKPNFIIGYSVISDDKLEWLYIKADYRKQGIEELLTRRKHGSEERRKEGSSRDSEAARDGHSSGSSSLHDSSG